MAINADTIPRYAPPTQAELEEIFGHPVRTCMDCAHFREVRGAGVCVYDITLGQGFGAELVEVDARDEACADWRRYE